MIMLTSQKKLYQYKKMSRAPFVESSENYIFAAVLVPILRCNATANDSKKKNCQTVVARGDILPSRLISVIQRSLYLGP